MYSRLRRINSRTSSSRSRCAPLLALLPAQLRRLERRGSPGIGESARGRDGIGECREARELGTPSLADRGGEVGAEIAEEQERRRRRPLLAHEEHRHLRGEQQARERRALPRRIRERMNALAERAISHLVVRLQERHERGRRQAGARFAARRAAAKRGLLSLEHEALGERAPELRDAARRSSRRSSHRARRSPRRGMRGARRRSIARSRRGARRPARARADAPSLRSFSSTRWTWRARPGPA
jgi:hypothetical protein